jgi:hypothetical protein
MSLAKFLAVSALASICVVAACSSDSDDDGSPTSTGDPSGNGGAGASGNPGPTSTSSTTGVANGGGGSGSGGAGVCDAFYDIFDSPDGCSDCLNDECCAEAEACVADQGCADCIDAEDAGTECNSANAPFNGLLDCVFGGAAASPCAAQCQQPICDSMLALPLSQQACAECLATNCCTEYTACNADPTCLGCVTGQITDQPTCDANAALTATTACHDALPCGELCPAPICDSGLTFGNAICANCLGDNCCESISACADDATCLACVTGETPANDPACTGSALLTTYQTCNTTSCGTECAPD